MKPRITSVKTQGKAIVENDDDGYLVMTPDGQIRSATTKEMAEKIAQRWFKKNFNDADPNGIGLGFIEWRTT